MAKSESQTTRADCSANRSGRSEAREPAKFVCGRFVPATDEDRGRSALAGGSKTVDTTLVSSIQRDGCTPHLLRAPAKRV